MNNMNPTIEQNKESLQIPLEKNPVMPPFIEGDSNQEQNTVPITWNEKEEEEKAVPVSEVNLEFSGYELGRIGDYTGRGEIPASELARGILDSKIRGEKPRVD